MSEIRLNWKLHTPPHVSEVVVFRSNTEFDKSELSGKEIAALPLGSTSYTDTDVEYGSVYYYRIGLRRDADSEVVVSTALKKASCKHNYYAIGRDGRVAKYDYDWNVIWDSNITSMSQGRRIDVSEAGMIAVSGYNSYLSLFDQNGIEVVSRRITNSSSYSRGLAFDLDGNVLAVSGSGVLVKISPTGDDIWTYTDLTQVNSIAVDAEGAVYVAHGTEASKIDADGGLVWRVGTSASSLYNIAVDLNYNTYLASASGQVVALDPNGTELWMCDTPSSSGSSSYTQINLMPDGNICAHFGIDVVTIDKGGNLIAHDNTNHFAYMGSGTLDNTVTGSRTVNVIREIDATTLELIRELDINSNYPGRDYIIQPSGLNTIYAIVVDPGKTRLNLNPDFITN